jgi:proton glutamate symport protein
LRRLSLTIWIFIGMAVGVLLGVAAPSFARQLSPVSNIFLRLVKTIVAPLIFGALVAGIAGSGGARAIGRIGLKSIVYFQILTTIALVLGVVAANIVRPGVGITLQKSAAEAALPEAELSVRSLIENAFPSSIIDAMARVDVLQIVVFCFLFGLACIAVGPKAQPVVHFADSLAEVMFVYTNYVMYLAPAGVGAAIAVTVGGKGFAVLFGLGKLALTLYAALILFVVGVFVTLIVLLRIPMREFYIAVREPFLIAFSTSSSSAALPLALENMEKFGVPKHIAGFVMPAGFSFNLNGTTIYLPLASLFVAQAAGVQLSLGQQVMMILVLMLTSKGVAAVARRPHRPHRDAQRVSASHGGRRCPPRLRRRPRHGPDRGQPVGQLPRPSHHRPLGTLFVFRAASPQPVSDIGNYVNLDERIAWDASRRRDRRAHRRFRAEPPTELFVHRRVVFQVVQVHVALQHLVHR